MPKNQNKKPNKYRKYMGSFVTTLLVVILVSGVGVMIYQHKHKTKSSDTAKVDLSQIPSWWYQQYFNQAVCDKDACRPDADPDHDGLTNAQEFYYHTNPIDPFTVKDKLNDGQLVAAGFDPSRTGHMTFDQVTSPDNILGESLLMDKDVKDIINQQNDISKVQIQLVDDSSLKVTTATSPDAYNTYFSDMKSTVAKYFSDTDLANIGDLLKSGSGSDREDIQTKANILAGDLKQITVPQKMLTYHKYTIAFFQLLSQVLSVDASTIDPTSAQSDTWYENVQALLAVSEKLNDEEQRLIITQPQS